MHEPIRLALSPMPANPGPQSQVPGASRSLSMSLWQMVQVGTTAEMGSRPKVIGLENEPPRVHQINTICRVNLAPDNGFVSPALSK